MTYKPNNSNWYKNANSYWQKSQTTYDGVMSGYGKYSNFDIAFSKKFITKLQSKYKLNFQSVLDCGAGIGRVTIQLLQHFFNIIDLVDQSSNLIQKSKFLLENNSKIRNFYVSGLQQFQYVQKYDCIWIQWVLSQLKNDDAVQFLKKSKQGLNPNGIIIIKQNESEQQTIEDNQDNSYIRNEKNHKQLFQRAGLKILQEQADMNWPQQLHRTKIYALI